MALIINNIQIKELARNFKKQYLNMNTEDIEDFLQSVYNKGAEDCMEYSKLVSVDDDNNKEATFSPQEHYDNSTGSLYKIAQDRGWNAYQFDIVKRIDRALKKGQFESDLNKSVDVIKIWQNESK